MDYLETKATLGTKRSQTNGLSRDKGNIGHKAQNEVKQMDYLETKATLGTKRSQTNGLSRDKGNIGHKTKSNKWTI